MLLPSVADAEEVLQSPSLLLFLLPLLCELSRAGSRFVAVWRSEQRSKGIIKTKWLDVQHTQKVVLSTEAIRNLK